MLYYTPPHMPVKDRLPTYLLGPAVLASILSALAAKSASTVGSQAAAVTPP